MQDLLYSFLRWSASLAGLLILLLFEMFSDSYHKAKYQ